MEQIKPRENTDLHLAVMEGHAEIVRMLLDHNSSTSTSTWGNIALHEGASHSHNVRSAWSLNNNHGSALHQARLTGYLPVVISLLKVTHPWIIIWSTFASSGTCLHGAVLGKNLEHMLHNSMVLDAKEVRGGQ
eukprot:Gb_00336 [translate_table: standard]